MARSFIGFLTMALLLMGCSADAPQPGESAFSCTPDTLHAGSNLTIKLPDPAEGDLAFVDPNGTVFFAYRQGQAHPQLTPVPDQPALSAGATLRFPVDSLRMKPYAYDARAAIPVFRHPGAYTLRLGRELANGVTPAHTCTVHFASDRSMPAARP